MANQVKLPRLGQGMEAGTIVRWLKSEGDQVEKGEPLYELDTDKVTQEVEADFSGVLLQIAVEEGEVPVGETIATIGQEGEKVPAESPDGNSAKAAARVEDVRVEEGSPGRRRETERDAGRRASTADETTEIKTAPQDSRGARVKASPLARRIARERDIDLATLKGTGPDGRIVAEDVERAEAAPPLPAVASAPAGEVERRELTSVRKTVARRLTEAWEIPVFQLQASADTTRVQTVVERLRERDVKATVTDVLIKVCAVALLRHREVNAEWSDDAILIHPSANVGIAVAVPQGLVVPVLRSVERLSLPEIASARAELVSRAREGKLRHEDLDGGTFTISNLGMYEVERFTAVLNPPQAAIVAVGAIQDQVVVVDGEATVRPLMTLVGTFDHRAVDGAPAAAFIQTVKELLEEPALAL
jgi:pyruvate dehydrogenase E2 component (dihydrolipoyllysine-residue acetyltransferase)